MKPLHVLGCIACALVLGSCTLAPPPAASRFSTSAPDRSTATSGPVACPSESFTDFFSVFTDSIAIQKAFVADLVQNETVDADAKPEPQSVSKTVQASQLSFPLIPSTRQQAREKLQLMLRTVNAKEATARLVKEDTDYQVTYFFRQQDGCWKLYRMVNDSL